MLIQRLRESGYVIRPEPPRRLSPSRALWNRLRRMVVFAFEGFGKGKSS